MPIRVDDDLHKQLKIITIQNDTSIQEVVIKFLEEYVKSHQDKKK